MFSIRLSNNVCWRARVRKMSYEEMTAMLKSFPEGSYAYRCIVKRIRKLDRKANKIFN